MKLILPTLLTIILPFPAAAETEPPHTVVLLIAKGQVIDSEEAIEAIRSRLNDLPVHLETRHLPDRASKTELEDAAKSESRRNGIRAVIWLDATDPSKLCVIATSNTGTDRFERILPEESRSILKVEHIALISRATIHALLAMETVEPETKPAAPQKTEPPPPHPSDATRDKTEAVPAHSSPDTASNPIVSSIPRTPIVGVSLAYAYRAAASTLTLINGFYAGLTGRIGKRFRLVAGFEVRQTVTGQSSCVRTEISSHPITVGGEAEWRWGRFSIGPHLAVTLDVVTRKSVVRSSNGAENSAACQLIVLLPSELKWQTIVALGATAQFHIIERLALFATIKADTFLSQSDYVAPAVDGSEEVIFDFWKIQPALLVGFAVGVL